MLHRASRFGIKQVYTSPTMKCWALTARVPARGGFCSLTLDNHGNVLSQKGQMPHRPVRETLFVETDLEKIDRDLQVSPVFMFLVQNGIKGAGHDAVVGPFVNRQPGRLMPEGEPNAGKVEVMFDSEPMYLDQNWPPPGTGWAESPKSIHGFMAGLPSVHQNWRPQINRTAMDLVGEIPEERWRSRLWLSQTVELDNGVKRRTLRVKNVGSRPSPFAFASHPDWLVPEEQTRGGVLLKLPGEYVVAVDKELHPDLSQSPFIPVQDKKTPVAPLFLGRDSRGYFSLGDRFIDNCFTGLPENPVFEILFPAAGYGIQVKPGPDCTPGLINAFQVFAPLWKPDGAFREIALELQIGAACPFDPRWERFGDNSPFFRHADPKKIKFLGSGMCVIQPGQEICWQVEERMIPVN